MNVRFSRRPVPSLRHIEGRFPDAITAHLCTTVSGQHFIVDSLDHVTVGKLARPVTKYKGAWTLGKVRPDAFFAILAGATDDDPIHNEVSFSHAGHQRHEPPATLQATLYPYQTEGYSLMRTAIESGIGVLLLDEMGLGKTIQAIAVLLSRDPAAQHLVICPGSLVANWERELQNFAPNLSVQRHLGNDRTGVRSGLTGSVVLTSYETAVNDEVLLSKCQWDVLILDEAQKIKNPSAQRSMTPKRIPRRATICITGTPVENSLVDLWSLSEAALPGLLGDLDAFEMRYPDEFTSAAALGRITAPVTVRRSVAEVGSDLPPKVDSIIPIDPPTDIAREHQRLTSTLSPFEAMTTCRVLTAHAGEVARDIRNSPKGQVVLDAMESILGHREKALIFASFQHSLDRLGAMIAEDFPGAWIRVIDGRMAASKRQSTIDDFSAVPRGAVLLMNPQAAGVGMNIVAANHVIHFDPEWNPAVTAQATARAHRRKQERTVFVRHLYYQGTVEEQAMQRSAFKDHLAMHVSQGSKLAQEEP